MDSLQRNSSWFSRLRLLRRLTGKQPLRSFLIAAGLAASLFFVGPISSSASEQFVALNGTVTSAEEDRMEGVLVSAKRAGSIITTTVVTDQQGRY